jgi:hypothetical protein
MTRHVVFMTTLLLFGLWSCFSKKPSKPTLAQWVEQASGGELKLLGSVPDIDPRRLFDHKKKIILADSRDSLVQLTATAVTSDHGFGLNIEALKKTLLIRRKEKDEADRLYAAFAAAGLADVSVGVVEEHVYVLLYHQPDKANREAMSVRLAEALNAQNVLQPVKLWLDWMEPSALRAEVGPVIPFGYWHRGDSYHDRNRIYLIETEWQDELSGKDLAAAWTINTGSNRSSDYARQAFEAARTWAAKDASRPSNVQDSPYRLWADPEHHVWIHFAFPIGDGSPENQPESPEKYVTGIFDPDTGTFTGIHVTDTL